MIIFFNITLDYFQSFIGVFRGAAKFSIAKQTPNSHWQSSTNLVGGAPKILSIVTVV